MTFEEFIAYVRERVGQRGTEHYWRSTYDRLLNHTANFIKEELDFLIEHCVADDYIDDN